MMNVKDKRQSENQSLVIEDLSTTPDEAQQVKGGYTVKLADCLVSSYQTSGHGG